MEVELTSHTTVRTRGLNLLHLPWFSLKPALLGDQRSNRTGLDTFTAKHTIRMYVRSIPHSNDLRSETAVPIRDSLIYLNLVTGLNTTPTHNTS